MELDEADLWGEDTTGPGQAGEHTDSDGEAECHSTSSSSSCSSSEGSAAGFDSQLEGSMQSRQSLGFGSAFGRLSTHGLSINRPIQRSLEEPDIDSPLKLATSLPIAIPKASPLHRQRSGRTPRVAETASSPSEAEGLVPPHTLADIQKKDQAARTMDASMFKPSRARSLHLVHRDSILEVTDMLDSLQVPAHGTRDSMGGVHEHAAAASARLASAALISQEPPSTSLKAAA